MHIDSTPIAMDMTSSPTITSGRGTSDRGDRAENWAQFDNINCDKTTTEEWNNSTSDVDNRLNRYTSYSVHLALGQRPASGADVQQLMSLASNSA